MIEQTQALQSEKDLSALVRGTDQLLREEFEQYARLTRATWDIGHDQGGRPALLLALRDPFGYTSDRFAPEELRDARQFSERVHRLVGDLLQSSRRVHIPIKEATFDPRQLEDLRMAMNSDPQIVASRPQLHNQVRINADGTFTIWDFSIEADESVAEAVERAIRAAGFEVKGEALADRPDVQRAVAALVEAHRRDPEAPPRLVIWFRLGDPKDIHLLEVSDEVADPGDGSLEGVSVGAGGAVPGARSIVIYLASPQEVHKAILINGGHPAVQAMLTRSCRILYPPDGWRALFGEFPELTQQTVP